MHEVDETINRLVDEYSQRRISRRDFFRRAAQAGVTASGAAALLTAAPSRAAATTTPSVRPVKGGVLLEGYNRDVSIIDPVTTPWWDPGLFPVAQETLITQDASGKFIPLLAESWDTSSDGLTWTFHLRPGLKFQSGAPCDASAVAAALAIEQKMGVNAPFWDPVTKITAPDKTTVVISLAHPYEDLQFVLNTGYSAVFNEAFRKKLGTKYGTHAADGTGPFTLVELVPGSHSTYKRWDGYAGAGSSPFFTNKGPAYLDGIQFVVLLEPASRAQELIAGNIDTLLGPAPQDFPTLQAMSNIGTFEYEEWGIYQLGLNFKRTNLGFNNPVVRRALSMAIDRDAICKTIFFGKAVPTYTLVPPAFPWYEKSVETMYPYDPEKAKSLLRSAGHSKITFTAIVETEKIEQVVVQAVQEMLAQVGVTMNLQVHGADWFTVVPKSDAYTLHNVWPYMLDASLIFTESKLVPPSCCNISYVNVPSLDKAFAAWQSANSTAELKSASQEVQTIFTEQMPWIPLVTPMNLWAYNKRVHNWMPTQPNLYPFYQDIFLTSS